MLWPHSQSIFYVQAHPLRLPHIHMISHCLQFDTTGRPTEVLHIATHTCAMLGPHEVRLAMRYTPINPADLNFMEGTYGKLPTLPAIPGTEGCGEVIAIGPAVSSLKIGDCAMPLHGGHCWRELLTLEEHQLARLPDGIDRAQASMLRVNPLTAWQLLHHQLELQPGVGRALIQIAKKKGYRTINFVRRPELIPELKALGADAVYLDNDAGLAAAQEHLQGHPPRLAGNAVGGDSALRLMELLAPQGIHVTYGAMSRQSLKVPNKHLIFKGIQLRGLWVTRWLEHASHAELFTVLRPLAEMIQNNELHMAVEEIYPAHDYAKAIARASQSNRTGKILIDLSIW
jgi:mitochondrial enoyl-[acyl-carrier protein] reductase / trans-2-enoyl-CoA reductase